MHERVIELVVTFVNCPKMMFTEAAANVLVAESPCANILWLGTRPMKIKLANITLILLVSILRI